MFFLPLFVDNLIKKGDLKIMNVYADVDEMIFENKETIVSEK